MSPSPSRLRSGTALNTGAHSSIPHPACPPAGAGYPSAPVTGSRRVSALPAGRNSGTALNTGAHPSIPHPADPPAGATHPSALRTGADL
ncbi:hypothetical protein ABZX95_27110 [Streptomyces sp. NPDC004232]|uniref:hypothetical protein n=1 Tax=Streptomyces sp. NPDC004232 TaxID=3154454 RepID=UPI0033AF8F11